MNEIPEGYLFTETHEWVVCDEAGVALVGISDHAQDLLGDVVFVELPEAGEDVDQRDECAVVESVKTAADVYAPVSGKIIEVNEALTDAPTLINKDPYADGWLFKIELKDTDELDELFDKDHYQAMLNEQESEE